MDAKELQRKRAELERRVEQLTQDSQAPETQSPEPERLPAAAPPLEPRASNSSLSGQVLRLVLIGILALVAFAVLYRVLMTIVTLVVAGVLVLGVVVVVRALVGRD